MVPSTHCEQRCHGGPSSHHVPRIAHSSGARATPTSHTSLHHLPLAAFSPAQRPVPLTGGSHHVSPCTVPPTSDSPGFLLCFSCRLTMCHRSPRAAAHADSIPPVMLPGLSTSMEQSAFAKHPPPLLFSRTRPPLLSRWPHVSQRHRASGQEVASCRRQGQSSRWVLLPGEWAGVPQPHALSTSPHSF